MLWHAMPPELNTARLMAGAGTAPMLQAAAGWEALGNALETQAQELFASLIALKQSWTGTGSDRAIAAATPMVAWLQNAAQQAQQRAMKASAQAGAYLTALGMTPSLPEIATNHITHGLLSATNFFGINLVPIGFNETDYFVRMWNQAAGAMDIYQAETAANTAFEPLEPMKPILQPGVGEAVSGTMNEFSQMASQAVPGALRTLAAVAEDIPALTPDMEQVTQLLNGIGQMSGPMQQLMQPLQQISSLTSQTSSMGGTGGMGDPLAGGKLGTDSAQVGLLGAAPLSNHPLLGGSGPSVGMGLMHAEALPGSGGSGPRTSMMSQLIDKPGPGVSPAGAGSAAMGGAAPIGAMGQGSQSGAAAKPGLSMPAPLAEQSDEEEPHDIDDGDDW
jgi:PPE-repeat protein